ncbi:MAG: NAD(P)(+) transhydrogenase (Re/Si-specific) subunit beta [Balneolaceae bacterium]|nr:NAD(P)(+) transhydrogenase (Re/Si-specific) subunit beta [Balneolaceae bacterium]
MSELFPPSVQALLPDLIQLTYLVATGFFIVGIKRLGSPATARSGNQMAALGMLIGVIVTLFDQQIVSYQFIIAGVLIGGAIGVFAARTVQMTAMPEMVAIFNGFGGGASALVAWGEFARAAEPAIAFGAQDLVTIGLSIVIGSITFTGSFIAFGKLQGFISGNPITFPGQNIFNLVLTFGSLGLIGWFAVDPAFMTVFWTLYGVALLLGVLIVIPIGGADMPVVISLLNSFSGIAASMAGFVINNNLLIISGALVGAAGLILTNIMCVAMNRSLANVLFGAFGGDSSGGGSPAADTDRTVHETTAEDVALQCTYSDKVVIVPGYGLAVAQAQHVLKEVADKLEKKGVTVKYGIHPVAGRMPGHMNVLLAEADVPYDQLYDMEQINTEFKSTDVVLIIGANDVVNPAAKTNPGSPIYGMPIMNVDEARRTIIFKRSLSPGFAGIDNELFYADKNQMFFGDAKDSLQKISQALSEMKD